MSAHAEECVPCSATQPHPRPYVSADRQFHAPGDERLLAAVLEFNAFDLYSKSDSRPDLEALWPYYQGLIDKYLPGELQW